MNKDTEYHPNTELVIISSMEENIKKYLETNESVKKNNIFKIFLLKILTAVKQMSFKNYWTKANVVEAWGFATKLSIIVPGLLFGHQWWWLYIFAIVSSIALIWSSTVKTLPTIILFNVAWVILASTAILKHFL